MVGPQLRALMVAAPGQGTLTGDDVRRGAGHHPVCGDQVELDLRLRDGCIVELRWRAAGCPASLAVAAAAAEALPGTRPALAAATLRARLSQLGDLAAHERHAEAMLLRALHAALAAADGGG